MKLHLSPDAKITDITKQFKKAFPYLKLEFFRKKHKIQEGNTNKEMISQHATLIDVTGVMKEGEVEISPGQTVAEVEQLFQSKFNLPVQIFRRAKHSWIETTKTDQLTLQTQNGMGREASNAIYDEVALL